MEKELKLVGVKLAEKTRNKNNQSSIDCGKLWEYVEQSGMENLIPRRLNDDLYAVYFDYEGDETQDFSYFIGYPVAGFEDVPAQLHTLTIPPQIYARFLAEGKMPDCIAEKWQEIWNTELPRNFHYDFEIYNEGSQDWENAKVMIYIGVKE